MNMRWLSLLIFFLGFFYSFNLAHAEEENPSLDFPATCPEDYYGFITQVRSQNTRNEAVKDFFTMGYCQLSDIMALDEELDQLKNNFRSAAFDCKDTSTYKKDFERILMEQYFVRNVQNTRSDVINAVDAEQLKALVEEKLELLRNDMISIFVKEEERVSEGTFNDYFDNWISKYEDRLVQYRRCEEGAWAELGETWQDFIETLQDLDFSVDIDKGKSLKEILKPEVEVKADKEMTAFGSALKNAWEYVKGAFEKEKTKMEDPLDVADLSDSEIVTYEQAFLALGSSDDTYSIELASSDRMSRYQVLYGMGGSVAATNMQSIVIQMNAIIAEMTTKDLPNITTGAAAIYDKQCN